MADPESGSSSATDASERRAGEARPNPWVARLAIALAFVTGLWLIARCY
jgi:hypothetical protein